MARILTAGAECVSQTLDGADAVNTDTGTVRSGARSYKITSSVTVSTQGSMVAFGTATLGRNYFGRAFLNIGTQPTTAAVPIITMGVVTAASAVARLEINGTLTLRNNTTQIGSASAVLNTGQWYRIELRHKCGVGSIDEAELLIDGVQIAVTTTAQFGDTANTLSFFHGIASPHNGTLFLDDIALNDDTGASNNTWPGDGKVVLLLPVSDNSIGSWLAGSNATTSSSNLWDALNNTPPVGTATSNAVTAAISNKVSGATAPNGDFNLQSYASAGLSANDTVNAVYQMIVHGEDVATGAKTGTFEMVSNPAISATTISGPSTAQFGPDASGAVGAYPTNWIAQKGTTLNAPSVTIANSPVARITKTDTGTRAADCCFMGLYVDYTPGVPSYLGPSWVPRLGPILAR